jgi:hypothetical protein
MPRAVTAEAAAVSEQVDQPHRKELTHERVRRRSGIVLSCGAFYGPGTSMTPDSQQCEQEPTIA